LENILVISLIVVIFFGLVYQILSFILFKTELKNVVKAKDKRDDEYQSITILKPIKGIDDQLEKNLISFFKLDYPDYEIIFGLHSYDDPALEIVKKLSKKFPNVNTKVVISSFKIGLNPKINNLYNMYSEAKNKLILISDSNTSVGTKFLKSLANELQDKNVGLVTATIRGLGAKNLASLMENLHLNTFLTPSVVVASQIAKISIVIGKSILIPKILLQRIGGFEAFKNYLAEDFFMGQKVQELGFKIKTTPVFVNNINETWSLRKFLNRHTRWAKIRAKIRIDTYFLELLSNPIATSFTLGLVIHNEFSIIQFAVVSVLKSIMDYRFLKILESDIRWYNLSVVPLKDLIIGCLWFIPFINSKINWRNNHFRIQKDSLLEPILDGYS